MNKTAILSTLFLALSGMAAPAKKAAPDNYWAISLAPEFAHPDKHEDFWRTHQAGDVIEVYQACDGATVVAKATGKADGSWALSAQFGNLSAKVDGPGHLKFVLGDKPYATGQRVAPFTCKDNVPERIKPIVPQKGERTFAALTGPAKVLDQATAATLPTSRVPVPPPPPPVPSNTTTLPNGDSYVCNTAPVPETAVRSLEGIPTLGPNSDIYPGSLLQGKAFATGSFAPITISRSAGTISIAGINVEKVTADVPVVSAEVVSAAIAKLARQKSLGTDSAISFRTDVIYNADQLAYALGLDGRFLNGLDSTIHIDPTSKKNYVLATFTQTYFTASFEDPETKYSVFADEENFEDDEGQIAPDNPPLYVKSVGYGRTIYFLVTSPHDASAIETALNSAKEGKADGTAPSKGVQVPFSKILQESTVSYFIQGGDAITTLGQVGQISGVSNMYEAIKKAITDAKVAQLTDVSKGLAVNYTLAYLGTRQPASLGFATTSNHRTCSTASKKYASFQLSVSCIDDNAKITVSGPQGGEKPVFEGGGTPKTFNLDDLFIPKSNDNYVLRLQLYNVAGPSCLHFMLTRTDSSGTRSALDGNSGTMTALPTFLTFGPGSKPYQAPDVKTGESWNVGWIVDYRILLNRGTGAVTVTQGR